MYICIHGCSTAYHNCNMIVLQMLLTTSTFLHTIFEPLNAPIPHSPITESFNPPCLESPSMLDR